MVLEDKALPSQTEVDCRHVAYDRVGDMATKRDHLPSVCYSTKRFSLLLGHHTTLTMMYLKIVMAVAVGQSLALAVTKPPVTNPQTIANCRFNSNQYWSLYCLLEVADFRYSGTATYSVQPGDNCEAIRDHYNDTFSLEQLYVQTES